MKGLILAGIMAMASSCATTGLTSSSNFVHSDGYEAKFRTGQCLAINPASKYAAKFQGLEVGIVYVDKMELLGSGGYLLRGLQGPERPPVFLPYDIRFVDQNFLEIECKDGML